MGILMSIILVSLLLFRSITSCIILFQKDSDSPTKLCREIYRGYYQPHFTQPHFKPTTSSPAFLVSVNSCSKWRTPSVVLLENNAWRASFRAGVNGREDSEGAPSRLAWDSVPCVCAAAPPPTGTTWLFLTLYYIVLPFISGVCIWFNVFNWKSYWLQITSTGTMWV